MWIMTDSAALKSGDSKTHRHKGGRFHTHISESKLLHDNFLNLF